MEKRTRLLVKFSKEVEMAEYPPGYPKKLDDRLAVISKQLMRIAAALEKLSGCIGADGRLRLNVVEKKDIL